MDVGDVVQLKSGGPSMTVVLRATDGSGNLNLAWFDTELRSGPQTLMTASLPEAALQIASRP